MYDQNDWNDWLLGREFVCTVYLSRIREIPEGNGLSLSQPAAVIKAKPKMTEGEIS